MKPKLRLVKVVAQPLFVLDDGENLVEVTADPIQIAGGDWPTFATDKFPAMVRELEASAVEQAKAKDAAGG